MPYLILLLFTNVIVSAQDTLRLKYSEGESAVQRGDLPAAEKAFLQILELAPTDVGARVNLGVVYMREQKWDRALLYFNQAEKLAPQVPGIRLNIGLLHYRQGDYAAAIPAFESVVKRQPDSVQARRLLGLCYLFEERYADATNELEPLWPASNGDLSYLYSLAVAAGNAGQPDIETRAVDQLMITGKDSPLVHLLIGKAALAHEDYDQAEAQLKRAAAGDEKLPMVHYNLGEVYRHRGDYEKAKAEFLRDVVVEPDVAFNYDRLGLLSSLTGNHQEAESYFLDALKRDKKLGTSWFGLAKIDKLEKRYPDALKALTEAGALDPQSASIHYLRAQVLAAMGRKQQADLEFSAVQKLNKQAVDKLEREISGTKYRDPEVLAQ